MRPALFAATVERAQDAVFIIEINPEHLLRPRTVYANPAFFALTGFRPEDIEDGSYPEIIGPETDRAFVIECAKRVAAGEAVECQVRLYRKEGSPFWAAVRSHPLDEPAHYCVLMFRDVTVQRAAEGRIRLLSRALESASDLVIITDQSPSQNEPTIVYANQSFLDATGYASDEIVGRSNLGFYSAENDPKVVEAMRRNVEYGLTNEKEAMVGRKDGSSFWVEVVGKPFLDGDEARRYRIVIGRDITLRKRAMNELTLLLAAAESLLDRIILYERDASGAMAVVYENAAAAQAGRYRLSEMLASAEAGGETDTYAKLVRGEQLTQLMLEERGTAAPEIHEFTARSIRNAGGTVEAVVTIERRIEDVVYRQLMTLPHSESEREDG